MKKIIKISKQLYQLKQLVRYNNHHRNIDENVLEHTAFVCLLSNILARKYGIKDIGKVMMMAVIHDVGEIEIGEIPYDIKQQHKDIKKLLHNIEFDAVKRIFPHDVALLAEYEQQKTVAAKIVKMADILSVIIYTNMEKELGNKSLRNIYYQSLVRLKKKEQEIKEEMKNEKRNKK